MDMRESFTGKCLIVVIASLRLINMVKASVLEGVGKLEAHDYPKPEVGRKRS